MKIYLMTDMEGVAGVLNHDDWVLPAGLYYETGKEFLTQEVNAAVEGFYDAGATEIYVADGHGAGGINVKMLDPRCKLMRGWPTGYPLFLDETFDAIAFVGQHAKAGTAYSHITHTQWFNYIDVSINGVSIGEPGEFAMCASEMGIPTIFASGELALCREVEDLIPGIETVSVKEGTTPGKGDALSMDDYRKFNLAAIHLHPEKARQLIKAGAFKALQQAITEQNNPEYGIIPLKKPFKRIAIFRHTDQYPRTVSIETHPDSVIEVLNIGYEKTYPLTDIDKNDLFYVPEI